MHYLFIIDPTRLTCYESIINQNIISYHLSIISIESKRKYTFSAYFLTFFHFGSYIFILPLLVSKMKNTFHFGPYRYSFNRNILHDKRSVLLAQ